MLKAFSWRRRVRRDVRLLAEVVWVQDEVDEALSAVDKRVRVEGWPSGSEVVRCAREVAELRAELDAAVSKRLRSASSDAGLKARLTQLETFVVTEPRLILPGQRWSTALSVLPPAMPELQRATAWGLSLEQMFNRSLTAGARLPFSLEELDAFTAAWPPGNEAVEAVWKKLIALDVAGTLVRYLRRRARRTPLKPPANGPEMLLHVEFWRGVAQFRLAEAVTARVGPLSCRDGERFHVLRWLWQRERDVAARLDAVNGLSDGRAGLFELSFEVAANRPGARAEPQWERLVAFARRADAARGDADWDVVSDQLRLLLRVLESPTRGATRALPPLYRAEGMTPPPPPSPSPGDGSALEALVAALRDRSRRSS
jgi:hypothetical protein